MAHAKTLIVFLALCIGASAQPFMSPEFLETKWHLAYSNSNDGWKGPVAIIEFTKDRDKILRTIPINYGPFNTNWTTVTTTTNYIQVINGLPVGPRIIKTNGNEFASPSGTITYTPSFVTLTSTNAITKSHLRTICAVHGHDWKPGCGVFGCLVIHGNEPLRHCALCKRTERREFGPWK